MIKLVDFGLFDIDRDSEILKLDVEESQKPYVASIVIMLGRTYVFRDLRPRLFWIFDDEAAVGMALYYDDPDNEAYEFSQIFIDKRYQGRGYGRAAVKLVLDEMKQDGKYNKVTMCYVEGNDTSRKLFEPFGFVETSHPWDEIFMEAYL